MPSREIDIVVICLLYTKNDGARNFKCSPIPNNNFKPTIQHFQKHLTFLGLNIELYVNYLINLKIINCKFSNHINYYRH